MPPPQTLAGALSSFIFGRVSTLGALDGVDKLLALQVVADLVARLVLQFDIVDVYMEVLFFGRLIICSFLFETVVLLFRGVAG